MHDMYHAYTYVRARMRLPVQEIQRRESEGELLRIYGALDTHLGGYRCHHQNNKISSTNAKANANMRSARGLK